MIIIPRAFRKCPICKKTGCDSFVPKWGIYGEKSETGFHNQCLLEVLSSPEVSGHKIVDIALDLDQRQNEELERRQAKLEAQQKRIDGLKNRHRESNDGR